MLFHVKMTVKIPYGLDQALVDNLKAKEKVICQELQRKGKWVEIWRIAGQYANFSIFDVDSPAELHELLSNLPLFPFMEMEVTALCRHYSALKDPEA